MLLRGKDLVPKFKEEQSNEVANLKDKGIIPHLAIIRSNNHAAIDSYMKIKQRYGEEVGAIVTVHDVKMDEIESLVTKLNGDKSVHGIIIQLPLSDMSDVDRLLDLVAPEKDVDGLRSDSKFVPATPLAILNLLKGFNKNLHGKKVTLVGRGKLVGLPLRKMLEEDGVKVTVVHSQTDNPEEIYRNSDVIITATGKPGLIKSKDIKSGTVLVDAGTAGEGGKTVGDITPDILERDDIDVSPTPGGVGPLTVCALFEHVILAAQKQN